MLGDMLRVVVFRLREITDICCIVGAQNGTPLLLQRKRSHFVSGGVQASDIFVQEAALEGLLRLFALARCEAAIAVFVEASTHKVVQLSDDTITIEVVTGIRNTPTLSGLLQFRPGLDGRSWLEPAVVTDINIVEMRLVLIRSPMVHAAMDIIMRHHVSGIHIINRKATSAPVMVTR